MKTEFDTHLALERVPDSCKTIYPLELANSRVKWWSARVLSFEKLMVK